MGAKTATRQILVALDRAVKMDMQHFLYMLQTGRYMNDARIVRAMNCGTMGEAIRAVGEYGRFDAKTMKRESVAALTKAKWITPTAIKHARQIKKYAETKTKIRG